MRARIKPKSIDHKRLGQSIPTLYSLIKMKWEWERTLLGQKRVRLPTPAQVD